MNNSNSPSNPAPPRATLKLKVGARKADARKTERDVKAQQPAQPQGKTKLKPGAHWSDEYKERMQADMDALTSR